MTKKPSIPAWYVVHTQPKCESIAASLMNGLPGIRTYCPRIRFQKQTQRGKVWFVEALFPGYFFARFVPSQSLREIKQTQGVIRVVDFGGSLLPLPDSTIADFKADMEGRDVRDVKFPELTAGPIRGLKGIVNTTLSPADRIRVLLEFLGREYVSPPLSLSPLLPISPYPMIPHFPPAWAEVFGEDDCGIFAKCSVKDVHFVWRWICPGKFKMGSPKDEKGRWKSDEREGEPHKVFLTRGFWLGETPVTQAQWQAVMGDNPSQFKGVQRPVERVAWSKCREFAAKLNSLLPGLHAALPTEAQWEYACRAGTQSAYQDGASCTEPSGKDPALDKLGWFDKNSERATHDVKQKAANAWGLYDMHGNVWEWCRDAWDEKAYAKRGKTTLDPETKGDDRASRIVRGGSWVYRALHCRAAFRFWLPPGHQTDSLGLRLAAGQEPAEPQEKERSDLP